jgi:hypothetical protein
MESDFYPDHVTLAKRNPRAFLLGLIIGANLSFGSNPYALGFGEQSVAVVVSNTLPISKLQCEEISKYLQVGLRPPWQLGLVEKIDCSYSSRNVTKGLLEIRINRKQSKLLFEICQDERGKTIKNPGKSECSSSVSLTSNLGLDTTVKNERLMTLVAASLLDQVPFLYSFSDSSVGSDDRLPKQFSVRKDIYPVEVNWDSKSGLYRMKRISVGQSERGGVVAYAWTTQRGEFARLLKPYLKTAEENAIPLLLQSPLLILSKSSVTSVASIGGSGDITSLSPKTYSFLARYLSSLRGHFRLGLEYEESRAEKDFVTVVLEDDEIREFQTRLVTMSRNVRVISGFQWKTFGIPVYTDLGVGVDQSRLLFSPKIGFSNVEYSWAPLVVSTIGFQHWYSQSRSDLKAIFNAHVAYERLVRRQLNRHAFNIELEHLWVHPFDQKLFAHGVGAFLKARAQRYLLNPNTLSEKQKSDIFSIEVGLKLHAGF